MYFSRAACGGSADPQSVTDPIRRFAEGLTVSAVQAVELLAQLVDAEGQDQEAALAPLSDEDKLLLSAAMSVYEFVDEVVCGACPHEQECAGEDGGEDPSDCFSRDLSWAEEWASENKEASVSDESVASDAFSALDPQDVADHRAVLSEFMSRLCNMLPFVETLDAASSAGDAEAASMLVAGLSDSDVAFVLEQARVAEPLCASACDRRDELDEARSGVSVSVEPCDGPDDVIALCSALVAAYEVSR